MKSFSFLGVIFLLGIIVFSVLYYLNSIESKEIILDDGTVLTILEINEATNNQTKSDEVPYEGNYFYHERYGFGLHIPLSFRGVEQKIGNASAVLLFRDETNEEKAFQVFVTPYGQSVISEERIQQDLGGSSYKNLKNVTIGNQNIEAVSFEHESPMLGILREVWFIHNDFLYEFSVSMQDEEMLSAVLQTIIFTSEQH